MFLFLRRVIVHIVSSFETSLFVLSRSSGKAGESSERASVKSLGHLLRVRVNVSIHICYVYGSVWEEVR